MRAIVHKTQGKLDLRSLTVFGLNAKPATDTPIGYFGTGLKYAVAVLARNNISTTIWIDGKKWWIEQEDTKFRDKSFKSLILKTHGRAGLFLKTINLPFTTELGKNWELWQAFRELESNTRDEKGETFQMHNAEGEPNDVRKMLEGNTGIVVVGEAYVECFLNRDQYFLPDGLTQREPGSMSDRIQVFARKSKAVYYRSIRILELKESSENTYNILTQIQLTEDRTAKSEFDVQWEIQNYLGGSTDKEVVRRAISAPAKSFERKFDYEYSTRSDVFLDEVASAGEDATDYAKSILKRDRPPEPLKKEGQNWIRCLIDAISHGDYDQVKEVIDEHREQLHIILVGAALIKEKEDANNSEGRHIGQATHESNEFEEGFIPREVGADYIKAQFGPTSFVDTDDEFHKEAQLHAENARKLAEDDDIPF